MCPCFLQCSYVSGCHRCLYALFWFSFEQIYQFICPAAVCWCEPFSHSLLKLSPVRMKNTTLRGMKLGIPAVMYLFRLLVVVLGQQSVKTLALVSLCWQYLLDLTLIHELKYFSKDSPRVCHTNQGCKHYIVFPFKSNPANSLKVKFVVFICIIYIYFSFCSHNHVIKRH